MGSQPADGHQLQACKLPMNVNDKTQTLQESR